MKLHEYSSKQIFSQYGIPIPRGKVATNPQEVFEIANDLGGTVVVKSQVLVGGRGKAGGIRLAHTPEEARDNAEQILHMEIKGLPVRQVLVDEAASIKTEIYLGITNDRQNHKPVIMASSAGGVEIEEIARTAPEKIIKVHIDPMLGIRVFHSTRLAEGIQLGKEYWKEFGKIVFALWKVFSECDASLAEINPLVITNDGKLLALDGKMVIDDNGLYRHQDLEALRDPDIEATAEIEARKAGLSFIKLGGNIGCMVNGAGLAMATMDIIQLFGGEPANFLDIGGGADAKKVETALRLILADSNVKTVLFNIFGGITRCDEVARGILTALSQVKTGIPMIVRLVGTNAEEGRELLSNAKMDTAETLAQAAKKAVMVASGQA